MLAEESSVLLEMPSRLSLAVSFCTKGLKLSLPDNGTIKTLVGATVGGNEST